ncbi:hypothetical protein V2W30_39800 (plasmid) [Streptomyces sp. Q6]|uniref:Uncharacterized protein n=1 Tax=Streptomyces citrinus TaxID=3118173 RepID=A0ACD5AQ88_9ACTN
MTRRHLEVFWELADRSIQEDMAHVLEYLTRKIHDPAEDLGSRPWA